jgi:energy-converting hydrogenase Eha subunit A
MSSMDVVLTLVFSIVMLLFMSVPAMKLATMIEEHWKTPEKWHTPMVLGLTVLFSLLIGLFLRFA